MNSFQMIDVGKKEITFRRAVAQGRILLSAEAYQAILEKKNPKGDVLALAEVAGIQAAKKTADLIPLCHPLSLDQVRLHFEMNASDHSVTAFCEASATAKTGVEMEALCGVNGALLTIYDLSKAVNPVLTLSDIRLNIKEGGKSGRWTHPEFAEKSLGPTQATLPRSDMGKLKDVRVAVLTISDRCSLGEGNDLSGPAIVDFLKRDGAILKFHDVVPDEMGAIRSKVENYVREHHVDLVVTTGGTGMSPRDVTPDAISPLFTKKLPGIGEHLRATGSHQTLMSWISRSEAGMIEKTLVLLLPGSLKAVRDGLGALEYILPHALHIARGGDHS